MIRFCKKPSSWIWGIHKTFSAAEKKTATWLCVGPVAICLRYA